MKQLSKCLIRLYSGAACNDPVFRRKDKYRYSFDSYGRAPANAATDWRAYHVGACGSAGSTELLSVLVAAIKHENKLGHVACVDESLIADCVMLGATVVNRSRVAESVVKKVSHEQ